MTCDLDDDDDMWPWWWWHWPDSNFFNFLNTTFSKYFIEKHLLCEVNKDGFSSNINLLHAYNHSFLKNTKVYLYNINVEFQLICSTETWSTFYNEDSAWFTGYKSVKEI